MAIRGKVYIVPDQATKTWKLVVHNTGDTPVGVTNNMFDTKEKAKTDGSHDDNSRYGHGLVTQPGKVRWQEFALGGQYHQYTIKPGTYLRIGLRAAAWTSVPLPPLDAAPVEIDFKDFTWYAKQEAHDAQVIAHMGDASFIVPGIHHDVGDSKKVLSGILELMALRNKGVHCAGEAEVKAVPGAKGQVSHWEVWFKNTGKQAWIGTVAFSGAQKNDGLGLESMGVPHKGSRAMQRIEAQGNYGVTAEPGAKLRIGVRGYAWTEIALPKRGSVTVPIADMTLDTSNMADEFFDRKEVEKKRQEKLNKVRFFDGVKPLNDEIVPLTYRGAEAKARATFDAPHVTVCAVRNSKSTPGGGWVIEVESRMPASDERGKVGFIATLKLGDAAGDPAQLPPKKFQAPVEKKTWFLPRDAEIGGASATTGAELVVGTRGLGWFATIPLPKLGETVDTDKQFDVWGLREDQYNRRQLAPEFTSKCRL